MIQLDGKLVEAEIGCAFNTKTYISTNGATTANNEIDIIN